MTAPIIMTLLKDAVASFQQGRIESAKIKLLDILNYYLLVENFILEKI